ncbi:MAG: putative two-component sensor histidine kinase [Chloroflexi bacterium OLB15]|nr:MAG: putative two-component sensor histidine kinase [Chloroflexi bacterium OLB15]
MADLEQPQVIPAEAKTEVNWQALAQLQLKLAAVLDFEALLQELLREAIANTGAKSAAVLFLETLSAGSPPILRPFAITGYTTSSIQPLRETVGFGVNDADDPALAAWKNRKLYIADEATPALKPLIEALQWKKWAGASAYVGDQLTAAVLVELDTPLSPTQQDWLSTFSAGAGIALRNSRLHSQAVSGLNARMNELAILQRIDLELSEQIEPDHVYEMTLDWAMRYTGSQAGTIATFDEATNALRFVSELGYEGAVETRAMMRNASRGGIARRVANSGRSDNIPDVASDPDYMPVAAQIRSHLSVPVNKEDRVIAVISVESRKLNHYTDDHMTFLERLAARAGNAMDNARLFAETTSEREKLSRIVSNIGDVVIVFDENNNVLLMNQSAIPVLRLYADGKYEGKPAEEVLSDTTLLDVYNKSRPYHQPIIEEVVMPNGRAYNAQLSWHANIGRILVLQDITSLKETDQLKNELISTVSHDLKQPLTVMNGYLELLQMTQPLEGRPLEYVRSAQRSIGNMRGLIDDLLNLAKIESGIQLNVKALEVKPLLQRCVDDIRGAADAKMITLNFSVTPDDLCLSGDLTSINQVFSNLIGNAVKYTPPEGKVSIKAEKSGEAVLVTINDTGLGISPEDQARIFDRFYRVRRPETENIEGTGLGLAIVKRLVEIHRGQIGVESRLGEGSKFFVRLPLGTMESSSLEAEAAP